jgi:1,4-alpha-glucan branching enzyme
MCRQVNDHSSAARQKNACSLSPHHIDALNGAQHGDPFSILGKHRVGGGFVVRTFQPNATAIQLLVNGQVRWMTETAPGLFEAPIGTDEAYRLRIVWQADEFETDDPYAFAPVLTDLELHLIAEGRYLDLPLRLGANSRVIAGVAGVVFAVWAPNARSVSVVGGFNTWDARRHPMRKRWEGGIWELFVPGLLAGEIYKYALTAASGEHLPWKADPLARRTELPPRTGSVVAEQPAFVWSDAAWMAERADRHGPGAPISIYEVHVESWLRTDDGQPQTWDAAGDRLIPYVAGLGFTHMELMPITEYPFGGSWGYQPLSLFAPTARLGDPVAFARFIDRCHAAGIGIVLDWVPAHFPSDAHGLCRFDGTELYEHQDPREGFHHDWNTLIYNVGRAEVRGFLIASALWWLETFHIDALRVDAVASMLYRDYSRPADAWIPNRFGGRENLESISFLRELNATVSSRCPGAMVIAEESTAWPGVTAKDGLGFDFKWNMGWMHDTLRFFGRDPIHRSYHLDDITFGLSYGFSEAFVLPLSHDEVVHGKGSLLSRMPGDDWQRFANLRLLFSLMWTHPGKKLLFMGAEIAAEQEWNVDHVFPWPHPEDAQRRGMAHLIRDLNDLYRGQPALHRLDRDPAGFGWVIADDAAHCVFAFRRWGGAAGDELLVVANCTPVPRIGYRVGVARAGRWVEIFNSDSTHYGGSNMGNGGEVMTEPARTHDKDHALALTLPPLGMIVLRHGAAG